jgi:uncharacterized membrane protein
MKSLICNQMFSKRAIQRSAWTSAVLIAAALVSPATSQAQICNPGVGANIGVTTPTGTSVIHNGTPTLVAHIGDTVTINSLAVFTSSFGSTCGVTNGDGWVVYPDNSSQKAMQNFTLASSAAGGSGHQCPSADTVCMPFTQTYIIAAKDMNQPLSFTTNNGTIGNTCQAFPQFNEVQFAFSVIGTPVGSPGGATACPIVPVLVLFGHISITKQCVTNCLPNNAAVYGNPINFQGTVSNDSGDTNSVLDHISVSDNPAATINFSTTTTQGHPFDPVVGNLNNQLAPGDSVTYTGSYSPAGTGVALCGPFPDTISVTAHDVTGLVLSNSASATCTVCTTPCINVTKNCDTVVLGSPNTISGVVSNCGNVTLTNVVITDNVYGQVTTFASLAPGASQPYSKLVTNNTCGSFPDTVTASATGLCGGPVSATASSTCVVTASPCIAVTKSCDTVTIGSPNHISGVVSNCGNVTLTNIVITDSLYGSVASFASLAPGVSQPYSKTVTNTCGNFPDTVTASGRSVCGTPVQATAQATCVVTESPCIAVTKNCDTVAVGSANTISGVVSNCGNVTLTNIVLNDNLYGQVATFVSLAPGASQSYSKQVTNACGSFPDTITSTGRSICGTLVTATANATCAVTCAPQIKVYKQVVCYSNICEPFDNNLNNQKSATGVKSATDCPAFCYRITVTNAGNVTLTGLVVTDANSSDGKVLNLSGCGFPSTLAVGDSASCIVTTNHCLNSTNIVTATALGQNSTGGTTSVSASDTNRVTVIPISVACTLLVSTNNGVSFFAPSDCAMQTVGSGYIIRVVVTNTGSYALQNVNVTSATDLTSCLPRTGLSLAINGSITIDCTNNCATPGRSDFTVNVTAEASQANATICAYNSSGIPITVQSSCPVCVVCVGTPAIKVYKQVVCAVPGGCDAFSPDLTTQKSALGMRVGTDCPAFCYRITVTNTGNVVLTNVTVIDNVLGPITCVSGILPIGAWTNCVIANVTHCDNTTNIVTATGFGPPGTTPSPVISTDTNAVVVVPISVGCTLLVSIDNGPFTSYSTCPSVNLGHSYVIRTVITNNGSYPIDVTATSSTLCFSSTNITALAVGGSFTIDCPYTCSTQSSNTYCVNLSAVASQSLGHVCAYDSQGQPITATSQCCTCVRCIGLPKICVTKEVVCELPAGCADNWSHLATGAKTADNTQCPSFCYRVRVTNCGQEDLRNVTVVDNKLDLSSCGFTNYLTVGQTAECILQGVVHCNNVTNTVNANGVGVVSGIQTNATDTAAVVVLPISITCNLTVNGKSQESIFCDGQGHMITNAVQVCNTGSLPLSDITIDAPELVALGCTNVSNLRLALLPGQCTNLVLCIDQVTCPSSCGLGFSNHISITAAVDQTLTNVCSWTRNPSNQVVAITATTECTAVVECVPPPTTGCTPGFWKNCTIHWQLTGYSTGQSVSSVFNLGSCCASLGSVSLLDALSFGGGSGCGGAQTLLRTAVAGLLNASSPELNFNYAFTKQEVIGLVNAAFQSCNRDTILTLASELDRDNNRGCKNNSGEGLPCHQLLVPRVAPTKALDPTRTAPTAPTRGP